MKNKGITISENGTNKVTVSTSKYQATATIYNNGAVSWGEIEPYDD